MADVGAWLQGLGLGQYEAAFRDNGVDASVLPELTAEDLKEPLPRIAKGEQRIFSLLWCREPSSTPSML